MTSPSLTGSSGLRLPIELCERIIDWTRYTLQFGDTAIDYPTLRACTLVCSAWLPRARFNLFFHVAVRSTRSLRNLAAGAASCAWIRPQELQLTLPLRLSRKRPSRAGSLRPGSGSGSGSHDTEQEESEDANISLVDPVVAPALRAVSTLILVRSEWLFPPRYIALFSAQFFRENLRELRLHHVFFVTGRDLAQLLWSFPGLRVVDCFRAIVKFGDVGTARLPAPLCDRDGGSGGLPCSSLGSLKVDSCSSASSLILKAAAVNPANLTRVHIRSSFARWQPRDYAPLSTLVRLESLEIVLASPTAYSPLPLGMGLIDLYSDATRRILTALPRLDSTSPLSQRKPSGPGPLKHLSFTYEPGYATRSELTSAAAWHNAGELQDEDAPLPQEARTWTYARRASDAIAALLSAGFEDVLCEGEGGADERGLRPAFANLELLVLRLWDPYSVDDPWWDWQVQRGIPTLYALRELELRLDVKRHTWDQNDALWDPEDYEFDEVEGQRIPETMPGDDA